MKLRLLPSLLLLCIGVSCAKTIDGPTPQLSGVSNPLDPGRKPATVCNAQGAPDGWSLDLTGDNFAPLPIKTLTSEPGVMMPTVSLSGPESYELPRERVFFVDKTRMAVRMPTSATNPPKSLPAGTYALTLTNPNGKSATLEGALAVVPPPSITRVIVIDSFSQTSPTRIQIEGSGFRQDALPKVTISGTGLPTVPLTDVTFVSATQITAKVPANIPPGEYDLTVTNPDGCSFTLPKALKVAYVVLGTLTIDPRFGWQLRNQAVTIYNTFVAPNSVGFSGGAPEVTIRAPLKSDPTVQVDIPLRRVAYVSPTTITAVVPDCSGMAALPVTAPTCPNGIVPGTYEIRVRDPSGATGTIPASRGFTVLQNEPPVITALSPSAIDTKGLTGSQELIVTGKNFGQNAVVQIVFQVPVAGELPHLRACTLPPGTTAASATTLSAQVPTTLPASACTEVDAVGNVISPTPGGFSITANLYVIRVQNTTDPAYADYSGLIVTNPAANPVGATELNGTQLSVARADSPLVVGSDDVGQHFVYALGGTDGTNLLASVEVAPLTLFGSIGGDCTAQPCKFRTLDRTPLGYVGATTNTPRPRRGLAAVVHTVPADTSYVYVIGGKDADGELNTVERAQVLRNVDAPSLATPTAGTGGTLAAGTYYYRVSAILNASDPKNPGGETLPSDVEPITVDANGKVTLSWACSTSAVKYRIYRTIEPNKPTNTERLLKEVNATASCSGSETFVDDGSSTPGGDAPLPQGALGRWVSVGTLNVRRAGLAAKIVPGLNPGEERLFVVGGYCTSGTDCAAAGEQATLEYTSFNGPDISAFTFSGNLQTKRRHHNLAVASAVTAPNSFSQTNPTDNTKDAWLVVVGGDQGGALFANSGIEVAKVRDSSGWVMAPTFANASYNTASVHGGWAEIASNVLLHAGGSGGTGAAFRSERVCPGGGNAIGQCTGSGSFTGTLNSVGGASYLPTAGARYLGGAALFRAYVYVVGGFPSDAESTPPVTTVDRFIY